MATESILIWSGEVESRGAGLTLGCRDRHDAQLAELDSRIAEGADGTRQELGALLTAGFPRTEPELPDGELACFTFEVADPRTASAAAEAPLLAAELVRREALHASPIEDFLPRSAAGIFQSNLTGDGTRATAGAARRDAGWHADVSVPQRPTRSHADQQHTSLNAVDTRLGIRIAARQGREPTDHADNHDDKETTQ